MGKVPLLVGWLLLLPLASAAQTIRGSVTNAAGEPLPAAPVLVQDSAAVGVSTYYAGLQNGRYALKVDQLLTNQTQGWLGEKNVS